MARDIVEFAGELFERNERQGRKGRAFLDARHIFVEGVAIEVPGIAVRGEVFERLMRVAKPVQRLRQLFREACGLRCVRADHPVGTARVHFRGERLFLDLFGAETLIGGQAPARALVVDLAVPIIHRDFVEEVLVAEDRKGGAERLPEGRIGGGAPGDGSVAGFDPAKIQLAQGLADKGDRGRIIVFADEDGDPQIDKLDRLQDFENRGIEDLLDALAGADARVPLGGCFPRGHPAAHQLVVIAERLIESGGDVDGQRDRPPREINRVGRA